jgi:hypothetical protein
MAREGLAWRTGARHAAGTPGRVVMPARYFASMAGDRAARPRACPAAAGTGHVAGRRQHRRCQSGVVDHRDRIVCVEQARHDPGPRFLVLRVRSIGGLPRDVAGPAQQRQPGRRCGRGRVRLDSARPLQHRDRQRAELLRQRLDQLPDPYQPVADHLPGLSGGRRHRCGQRPGNLDQCDLLQRALPQPGGRRCRRDDRPHLCRLGHQEPASGLHEPARDVIAEVDRGVRCLAGCLLPPTVHHERDQHVQQRRRERFVERVLLGPVGGQLRHGRTGRWCAGPVLPRNRQLRAGQHERHHEHNLTAGQSFMADCLSLQTPAT